MGRPAALAGGTPCGERVGRHLERAAEAERLFGAGELFGAERLAMRFRGAGFLRRSEADRGLARDHRRPVGFARRFDRLMDCVGIMPVDRDTVVVEQHDQLVELEMAGERDRFLRQAFHQVAVGGEHEGVVVDQILAELRRQHAFRQRHADRIAQPLAERPGRGLDARGVAVFRMAGRDRAELAEPLDLLDGHRLVAEQIQGRIDQHRAVAGRKYEAVAVRPGRIGGIEFQEAGEKHGRDIRRPHGEAGMSRFRLFDRIHRE